MRGSRAKSSFMGHCPLANKNRPLACHIRRRTSSTFGKENRLCKSPRRHNRHQRTATNFRLLEAALCKHGQKYETPNDDADDAQNRADDAADTAGVRESLPLG